LCCKVFLVNRIAAVNLTERQPKYQSLEAVVREYKEWLAEHTTDNIPNTLQYKVKQALEKSLQLMKFEESIEHSAAPHDEEYRYYIEYERKGGEPARVTCIFERAITENPLNTALWTEYLSFLDNMLNVKTVVLSCYARAVRNIPWVVDVWTGFMIAQQRHNLHFTHIDGTLEEALKNGFTTSAAYLKLWQCYLDCHWRHIRFGKKAQNGSTTEDEVIKPMSDAFTKAVNSITQSYGEEGDPRGELTRFMARVYAVRGDVDSCRDLMDGLVESKLYNYQSEVWLEYIGLEKQYGSIENTRKLYQKAYQISTDQPLMASFMDFERFYGTLEQVDNAALKCKRQQKKVDIRLAKEAKERADEKAKRKAGKDGKGDKSGKGGDKGGKGGDKADKKRDKKAPAKEEFKAPAEKMDVPEEGSLVNRKRKHSGEIDKSRYPLTVFVSNLAFAANEDTLNDVFKSIGTIADIRLVRGVDGNSRGYGYVEFTTREAVMAALEMDRSTILGRPSYVSECLDKGRGTPAPFKYEAKLEPNKLFVSNLPQKYTQEEVIETFSKHGKVASVRMVTTKGGAFKGFCYVVYEEEEAARNAVVACSDLEIAGRKIQVAISNPPKKGDKKPNIGSNTEKGEFANTSQHRRQMMSFAPRSTVVKSEEGASTTIQAKAEGALASVPATAIKQEPMDIPETGQKDNSFFASLYKK